MGINDHGIKGGLANHQTTQRQAVECGYFPIFRYDPRLEAQGKNPLTIDCKEPDWSKFKDFLLSQNRFAQLPNVNPANADALIEEAKFHAQERFERLVKMSKW